MASSFHRDDAYGSPNAQPKERSSIPVSTRDGLTILDINHYVPFLLAVVANAWQHRSSAHYRSELGLGVTDWRLISTLCIEPGATSSRICEVTRHDKSSVKRSLNTLAEAGYLTYESAIRDPRRRRWHLSDAGRRIHDRLLRIALANEATVGRRHSARGAAGLSRRPAQNAVEYREHTGWRAISGAWWHARFDGQGSTARFPSTAADGISARGLRMPKPRNGADRYLAPFILICWGNLTDLP